MKSSFQTIVTIVFIIAFVVAVAVFSGLFSSNDPAASNEPQGSVLVWGVLPSSQLQGFINGFNGSGLDYSIIYVEHAPETFAQDLTVALADGVPPDVVLVTSELFSQFKDKLYPIPYDSYSERAYRDTNIDGAQIFLSQGGIMSIPLLVDPLVVYYNKDLLAAANYALPPRTWSDLARSIPRFTKRDARGTISQTTIALGETQNVDRFSDILSALFLQSGISIVSSDKETGVSTATLAGGTSALEVSPAVAAVDFYTSFNDPTSGAYSWNRSLPGSLDFFVSGRSAFYIGRASELFAIQAQNPNLNFDVMELFQTDGSLRPITFGSFVGASVLKNAPNMPAAYAFIAYLSANASAIDTLSKAYSLPPVRRDLLLTQQENPYVSVFFKAALSSFAWPDPNHVQTQQIFRDMIQAITSGRADTDTAINEANQRLQSNIR